MEDKQTLIIIRGIPGSGKSTYAETLKKDLWEEGYDVERFEADDFWIDDNGDYIFRPELLGLAHRECWRRTFEAFDHGLDYAIVSNTFTTAKEMEPYLKEAETRGLNVVVYRMDNEFGSIHGVPAKTIESMKARFVDYPGEIKIKKRI